METAEIKIERSEAQRLYEEYKQHRHFAEPVDDEIRRTYREIAKGNVVIKALESIIKAGVQASGYPKLAIVRADQPFCYCDRMTDGRVIFHAHEWTNWRAAADMSIHLPSGSMPRMNPPPGFWSTQRAITPIVPGHLRPKHALSNYHVLFEAEWSPNVPKDPLLLRRFGKADLWLVVAAWDLTEVERVALQARVVIN